MALYSIGSRSFSAAGGLSGIVLVGWNTLHNYTADPRVGLAWWLVPAALSVAAGLGITWWELQHVPEFLQNNDGPATIASRSNTQSGQSTAAGMVVRWSEPVSSVSGRIVRRGRMSPPIYRIPDWVGRVRLFPGFRIDDHDAFVARIEADGKPPNFSFTVFSARDRAD
ncbi:MAG: hypothetical protein ABEN55_23210 [Bradymonadaceae bacterium]